MTRAHGRESAAVSPLQQPLPAEVTGREPPAVAAPLFLPCPGGRRDSMASTTTSVVRRPLQPQGPLPPTCGALGARGLRAGEGAEPGRPPTPGRGGREPGRPPASQPPSAVPLRRRRGERTGRRAEMVAPAPPPPPLPPPRPCAPAGWRGPSCRARRLRARRARGAPRPAPRPPRSRMGSARCCQPAAGAPWAATWARGRGGGAGRRREGLCISAARILHGLARLHLPRCLQPREGRDG